MPANAVIATAAGLASALFYVSLMALGPILGAIPWIVSPAPLVLVGVTKGWTAGMVAALTAMAAFGVFTLSFAATLIYIVSDILPAVIVMALALRPAPGVMHPDPARVADWYPPGEILVRLAMVPTVVLIVLAFLAPGHPEGLEGLMRDTIGAGIDAVMASVQPQALDDATRDALVVSAATILPGAMAMSWLLRMAAASALAQAVASRSGHALRPSPSYIGLELPGWYGIVFGLAVAIAVLTGGDVQYVAWSATVGLSVPFLLLGFKLVHAVARRTPYPVPVLGVFYIVFLSVSAVAFVAMVLVGLVEYSANLRRRAAGRTSEEE